MTTICNIILHTMCNVKDSYIEAQTPVHITIIYKEYQHHVYLFYLATEKYYKIKGFQKV